MIALAFWNIAKKNVVGETADLASQLAQDSSLSGVNGHVLLCLVESGDIDPTAIMGQLSTKDPNRNWWFRWSSVTKRFLCFGSIPQAEFIDCAEEAHGWLTRLTRLNGQQMAKWESYPICFVHLASPLGAANPASHQLSEALPLHSAIREHEKNSVSVNTVAMGDFNMTPFASGMISPRGLNAVSCMITAKRGSRTYQKVEYPYFYNPMWSLLGNQIPIGQPGSFYKIFTDDSTRWHLWDQVLIRPSLMGKIVSDTPQILTKIGNASLISSAGVIKNKISDHLPIMISIDI